MPRQRKNVTCLRCGTINLRKRSKYCSLQCSKQVTKKTSEKISKARTKYLKENPDKHVWKRLSKFKSEPCERVKKYLNDQGIKFIEEWNPLEFRQFSIDIAFPDIKLGIEVNGNQHYNSDGTLKEYYQKRHDLIIESGWKLIELHYSSCFNEELLANIISSWEQPDYSQYFQIKRIKQEKNKSKSEARGVKAKRKTDEKMIPKINELLNSNINFGEFGWVKKAATFLQVKEQKVSQYMKRYASEFYETNCFKRKTNQGC